MITVIAPDELKRHVSQNIIRLRKAQSIPQGELADRIGISRVQLNRIENGHNLPSVELLYAIADELGVSADDLRKICSSTH